MIPVTRLPPEEPPARSWEPEAEREREAEADLRRFVRWSSVPRSVLWVGIALLAFGPCLAAALLAYPDPIGLSPLILDLLVAAWAARRWASQS